MRDIVHMHKLYRNMSIFHIDNSLGLSIDVFVVKKVFSICFRLLCIYKLHISACRNCCHYVIYKARLGI